ncbi:N-acetylmuramoyl-L-alanine amidase family protein [Gemella sp. Musashino-2025]
MNKVVKITAKVLLSTALLSSIIIPTSNQARADWKQDENGWWYDEGNGRYLADGSWSIGGKAYRFDKRGYMVTGWYYDNGDKHERLKGWYYYDPVNGDEKRGWQKIDGKWYYFNAMALTGLRNIDEKKYYFDPVNGDMKTGWIKIEGKWHYFDPENGNEKSGWQNIDGKWYYFISGAFTGFNYINEKLYYFDPVNCDMKTGWTKVNGVQYYMDPNDGGAVARDKVLLMNGVYYTFNAGGKLIKVELANKN